MALTEDHRVGPYGDYLQKNGYDVWEDPHSFSSEQHVTQQSVYPEEHYQTTWIGDKAVAELEKWDKGGNLLMTGFVNPHHPFDPPTPWSEMYDPEEISLLPGWTEEALAVDIDYHSGFFSHADITTRQFKEVLSLYYGMISMIDYQVGRMIEILKEKGLKFQDFPKNITGHVSATEKAKEKYLNK